MTADSCIHVCMMNDLYEIMRHGRGNSGTQLVLLVAQQGRKVEDTECSGFEPSTITTCSDPANYWSYVQEPRRMSESITRVYDGVNK